MDSYNFKADYLVIGSGAAGLYAALQASRYGTVNLVTKSGLQYSSSYWAQGGIAAVLTEQDSYESHIDDTLQAGRGFCNPEAVGVLVREGAELVSELIRSGMRFDRMDGKLDLGLEGGHSNRRVLHANGASTGKALIEFLLERVKDQPGIQVFDHTFVYKLIKAGTQCGGAEGYRFEENCLIRLESAVTILATGGYSGIYRRSTNPHTSTGDGLWLALEAGAELQDLEFVQFHPTAFYSEEGSTFLISEALRGEGARLYNVQGERFMAPYPQKELAPRDVVSREIFQQIKQQENGFVYLDVRHMDINKLRRQFPSLTHKIEEQGLDMARQGIPVAPAAHYCIGGVATDLNGQTAVAGLYACGEVAATGVHGANRLASNSLLECLVFSKRAVNHAANNNPDAPAVNNSSGPSFSINGKAKRSFVELQQKVAEILSQNVGIERNRSSLQEAVQVLGSLLKESAVGRPAEYFALRSRALVSVAVQIANAAMRRKESRGVHLRTDFPEQASNPAHFCYNESELSTVVYG